MTRRDLLLAAGAIPLAGTVGAAEPAPAGKVHPIGVVSVAIRGKPQPRNGHTWHFAQYPHPACDLDAIKKYLDPGSADFSAARGDLVRPNDQWEYCHTAVFFQKKRIEFTPAIEGDFWYGHHYEMFRMAATFREMVKTRMEPIPHAEIAAVTDIVHAAARSLKEKSRLVELAEVRG